MPFAKIKEKVLHSFFSLPGDPARDIVMWMDHRAREETDAVNATRNRLLDFVGGTVSIEMQIPKILWLKKVTLKLFEFFAF